MNDRSDETSLQQQLDALETLFGKGRLTAERYEVIRAGIIAQHAPGSAGRPSVRNAPVSDEEYIALRNAARRPALLLDKMPEPDAQGAPGCWLGGLPTLPPDIAWPWFTYHGRPLCPMHFVAQIDLAALPALEGLPDRPTSGTLFFFATPLLSHLLDGGCGDKGRVFHVPGDVSGLPPSPMPAFPDFADFPSFGGNWAGHYAEMRTTALDRWTIGFRPFDSFGAVTDPRDAVRNRLAEEQVGIMEALEAEAAARLAGRSRMIDGAAMHHMFGRGTTGPLGDLPDPQAVKCQLLVLDDDADIGYCDYLARWTTFWIGSEDLAQGRFDRAELGIEGA